MSIDEMIPYVDGSSARNIRQTDFDALFDKMRENSDRMVAAWDDPEDDVGNLPEFEGTTFREFPMLSRADTMALFGYDGMLAMAQDTRYGSDLWFAALCDDVDDIYRLDDIATGSGDKVERSMVVDLLSKGDGLFTIATNPSPTGALKSLAEKNANKAPGYPVPFGYLMWAACYVDREGLSWDEALAKAM